MILYTIQTAEMYEKLLKEKELTNNGEFLSDFGKDFCCQYKWMAEQMKLRGIKQVLAAKYPFWAWYKYSTKKNKPDLRQAGHALRGTNCVCMELELAEDSVLLSNFDLWHCVLNDMPVFAEDEWDDSYAAYKKQSSEEQARIKNQSWEKIFTDFSDSPVQATFWQLRLDDVKSVQFFTAR